MAKKGGNQSRMRAMFVPLLGVAALGAIFVWIINNAESTEPETDASAQAPQNIELTPATRPQGVASASWRAPDGLREEEPEVEDTFAVLDAPRGKELFQNDTVKAERWEESLEERVKGLGGMAVYVAKKVDDKKDEPAKKAGEEDRK